MVEPGLGSEDILLPLPLGNRNTQGKRFCVHTMSFGQKTNIQKKSLKVCIDIIGNDLRMWKGCALSRWSTDFKHFHSEDRCGGLISEKRQSLVNYLWKDFRFLLHKAASTDLAFIVFVPGSKETMAGGLEARSIMNELAVLKWGPHHECKTASLIWQHPPVISASTREAGTLAG